MTEAIKSKEIEISSEETHKAMTHHFVELAKNHANLAVNAPSWSSSSVSGNISDIFGWLRVDLVLGFSTVPQLTFTGRGGSNPSAGALGGLSGQATFNVDPATLVGVKGITFQASGGGVVGGGFQITWFLNNGYIGSGVFAGLGVMGAVLGGGGGDFS